MMSKPKNDEHMHSDPSRVDDLEQLQGPNWKSNLIGMHKSLR